LSLELLTEEEKINKTEIISVTEELLNAECIECDSKVAKPPEETMRNIIAEVRKKTAQKSSSKTEKEEDKEENGQEAPVHAE
jgi:hypothetical protein